MGYKLTDATLAKVADDEPIFVLRAQDILAISAIYSWITAAERLRVSEEKIEDAHSCIIAMMDWQNTHRAKRPD